MTRSHRRDLPRSARRLQLIASALTGYTAFLVVLVSAGIGIALVLAPHIPQAAQP